MANDGVYGLWLNCVKEIAIRKKWTQSNHTKLAETKKRIAKGIFSTEKHLTADWVFFVFVFSLFLASMIAHYVVDTMCARLCLCMQCTRHHWYRVSRQKNELDLLRVWRTQHLSHRQEKAKKALVRSERVEKEEESVFFLETWTCGYDTVSMRVYNSALNPPE